MKLQGSDLYTARPPVSRIRFIVAANVDKSVTDRRDKLVQRSGSGPWLHFCLVIIFISTSCLSLEPPSSATRPPRRSKMDEIEIDSGMLTHPYIARPGKVSKILTVSTYGKLSVRCKGFLT